jgi:hypothetical protein
MGLKLVPLNEEDKPLYSWTEIYDNPDYWTPESLRKHVNDFKGVATAFGKTRIKDENGLDSYLHCFDIDSENAYETTVVNTDFLKYMRENTFIVKTAKSHGYHVYWLSPEQHEPVLNGHTKAGWEFEIKSSKASALSTLPPSRHREHGDFHYFQSNQKKELAVDDDGYSTLMHVLGKYAIRKTEHNSGHTNNSDNRSTHINDDHINAIVGALHPYWVKGRRDSLEFALNGVLHKSGVSLEDTVEIIRRLAKDDSTSDRRNAEKKVKDTYKKDCAVVSGWVIFSEALEAATGDTSKSNEILGNIRSILDSYKQEETEAAGMIPRDPEYLFALAQKEIKEQFRDQTTGAYYAVIEEEGRKKRLNMDHEEFDLFLSDIFLKSRHKILSKEISNNVKRTLKPQTKEERILYNRVTQIDHTLYYDLCNRKVL